MIFFIKTQTTDIWNYCACNDVHNFKVKIVQLSLLKDLERCLINSPRKPPKFCILVQTANVKKVRKTFWRNSLQKSLITFWQYTFLRLFESRFVYLMEKAEFSYVENILKYHFWGLKMSMPNLQLYLWNFCMINNAEVIVVFIGLKVFDVDVSHKSLL